MFFQITAIIILLAFYGCYFGKVISQKKKGIQTNQIGKDKEGFVKFIEVTMKIVAVLMPMVEVASVLLNKTKLPTMARIVGVIIAMIGVAVFICSAITMGDSWRAGVPKTDDTKLITHGIYQISRNPAFLGFDLVYIGFVLMFYNWIIYFVTIFAILIFHLQIVNVEEDHLLRTFGDEYLNYKKKVNRYIGRKLRS